MEVKTRVGCPNCGAHGFISELAPTYPQATWRCQTCGAATEWERWKKMEEETDSKVVSAVGMIVNSDRGTDVAAHIEEAMRQAVLQAIGEGIPITDSETIKARMLEAHLRARKELGLE